MKSGQNIEVVGACKYVLNSLGYLKEFSSWSQEWVDNLAFRYGFSNGASQNHMNVVDYVRSFYLINSKPPSIYLVTQKTGMDLRKLQRLFPSNLKINIAMMAGLSGPLAD
jgi:sulfur relay (sulfurtransferase) DsrC/TusE family protein